MTTPAFTNYRSKVRRLTYLQMAKLVFEIFTELKHRNPIGVNFYTDGLLRAKDDLKEIAGAERTNPTSEHSHSHRA